MLRSIRWRLPLSYAGIALLATLSLGAVLLPTLRNYYAQQEIALITDNAIAVSTTLARMQQNKLPEWEIQAQISTLAFLTQMRIELLDMNGALRYEAQPPADALIRLDDRTVREDVSAVAFAPFEAAIAAVPAPDAGQNDVNFIIGSGIPTVQWMAQVEGEAAGTFSEPTQGNITVNMARTPFGITLNTEAASGRVSDQTVTMPLLDLNGVPTDFVRLSNGPAIGMEILDSVARALLGARARSAG